MAKDRDGSATTTVGQSEHYARWRSHEDAKYAGIEERKDARASRTVSEQLAVLDARLGVGVGAKRERARLKRAS